MDRTRLSVIVCTYSRSKLINNLIEYFDRQIVIPPLLDLELVIVDNNSTDDTLTVVENQKKKTRNYELTYIFEENQGLSNARNLGISDARHNLLFFLDDDAFPAENFFNNMLDSIKENKTVIAVGSYDMRTHSRFLNTDDPPPIGSGIILSKTIFEKYGYFDTRYGYNQKKRALIPGEDTELTQKILKDGTPFYYLHNCIVKHFPAQNKFEIKTLSRIYLGQGFLFGGRDRRNLCERNTVFGLPDWYYKEFISTASRSIYCWLKGNRTGYFYYYLHFIKVIGRFWGYIKE